MAMSESDVKAWAEEFLDAMSAPVDWGRLKNLMSKRCTVEMPNEPKCKKFEDYEKKYAEFLGWFKGAKRSMPKGSNIMIVPAKKDELDVIVPELCKFNWTKELGEQYPNVNMASGEKAKIMIYNRFKLNGKKEATWYSPLFFHGDFKNQDRAEDDDTFAHKFYQAWNAGAHADMMGDEVKAELPVAGKMNKEQMLQVYATFKECTRSTVPGLSPVLVPTGKDEVSEGVMPAVYKFKWAASLNDLFKVEIAEDADVELRSFDMLTVKAGKLIGFQAFFDPAACIKPIKKSGAA